MRLGDEPTFADWLLGNLQLFEDIAPVAVAPAKMVDQLVAPVLVLVNFPMELLEAIFFFPADFPILL